MTESKGIGSSLLGSSVRVLGSNVLSNGLAFILGVITARKLGPTYEGMFTVLFIIPSLLANLSRLGTPQLLVTLFGSSELTEDEIVGSSVVVLGSATLISTGIAIVLALTVVHPAPNEEAVAYSTIILPLLVACTTIGGVLLARQRLRGYNRSNWLPTVVRFATTLPFLFFWPRGVDGALLGIVSGYGIALIVLFLELRSVIARRMKFSQRALTLFLRRGLTFSVALFFLNLHYRVDVLMLSIMKGGHSVGLYSVATALAESIWLLPTAIGMVVLVASANQRLVEGQSGRTTAAVANATLLLSIPLAVSVGAAQWFLLPTVYGSSYLNARPLTLFLLPAVVLMSWNVVVQMDIAGRGQAMMNARIMGPTSLLNIALNFVLIPRYGASGAAISSLISYSSAIIVSMIVYGRLTATPISSLIWCRPRLVWRHVPVEPN